MSWAENDMHVQQALALVSQLPELTEVLKIQLEVTEGEEHHLK